MLKFLCRIGWHSWRRAYNTRHWHLQCRRCGKRTIWMDADPRQGYQPIDPAWPRPPEA